MFQGMEYIYTVYQEKAFPKAAEEAVHLSHSPPKRHRKRVEGAHRLSYFDRSTKPLTLTEFGKRYISSNGTNHLRRT